MKKCGINTTTTTIHKRLKEYFAKKGKKVPKSPINKNIENVKRFNWNDIDDNTLKAILLKLRKTRNATDEQLQELADIYEIDLTEEKER